jgi:type I restriction enzyme S subunit
MAKATTSWERVKFGDVVRLVKETCKDPVAAGIERVIGLEHLEPGDLRVRSWADVADGTTFTTRVRPGQVLFGKRRAYQRKVAVSDFDAICSGDIYVFESAKPSKLIPDLLPFVCQTTAFFEHAVGTSAGSLSPRTNWSNLAEYEFALPPPGAQNRICKLLATIEVNREATKGLQADLGGALDALAQWYATAGLRRVDSSGIVERDDLPRDWQLLTIRQLCTGHGAGLTLGPFGSGLKVDDYGHLTQGTPVLFVADVGRFDLRHVSQKFISSEKHAQLAAHEAIAGDVLVTEMGWPPGEACVVPAGWPPSIIKADIIRARVNRDLVAPEYLELVLNSRWGQQQMVRISPGTTRPRMTLRDFEQLQLALPPRDEQQRAIRFAAELQARKANAQSRLEELDSVKAAALASAMGAA